MSDEATPKIELRPTVEADREFLIRVYASTRERELALVDWTSDQKLAFCTMQFDAQDQYWREHYPGALFSVILVDGDPAGRLYIHTREREIRLMDIVLLPAFHNRGLGAGLIRQVFAEGERTAKSVTIHVERGNPARRLYDRLGFVEISDNGFYTLMEWRPAGVPSIADSAT